LYGSGFRQGDFHGNLLEGAGDGLETDANVTALVEPTEDFARLENVLVILAPVEEVTVSGDLP